MNLADLVRDAAARLPQKPALWFHGRPVTYSELDHRVDLVAGALAGLGLERGDRVALLAGNVPGFIEGLYGALRAGAVACPLNVLLTAEELRSILADAGAVAAIVEPHHLPTLLQARERLPALRTVVTIGDSPEPAPEGAISLEDAIARAGRERPTSTTGPDDLAVIAYTAGTTAAPRGAMLHHRHLMANLDQMAAVPALAEAEDDVVMLALPLFHIYALNVVLGLTIRTGATAVLVDRFDPRATLELIARHGVTVLFGAPPMYAAWLAAAAADPDLADALGSVRLAVSGAAPLPGDVLRAFRDRFGVTIWEGYGLTESAPAVTTNALGREARPDSIGLPLPGLEVRLVDDRGQDVEEGDPGEILVRGPNVFAGYWGRPEATAEILDTQGWLHTGDVAVCDDDGYLSIVDRKRDLIIVSGFNVFPKEVEDALARHPGVAEAGVVGVPDDRTGEAVQAWVVPEADADLDPDEVVQFLRGYVARFKLPREIRVVDELPHHVTGKVLRRLLREPHGEPAGNG